MRCKEAQSKSSAYLDGELSDELSSAIRGHLRQCAQCEKRFEQESTLVEIAANLDSIEPPDRVWEGIAQKIAEAEIADSERHAGWRWLRARRRAVPAMALAAVAIVAVVVARGGSERAHSTTAPDPGAVSMRTSDAGTAPSTVAQTLAIELTEADRDYQKTIAELRAMLEADRASWTATQARVIETTLEGFRKGAIAERFAIADAPIVASSRDAIYANYRAEISFLQSALAGDLASPEETP